MTPLPLEELQLRGSDHRSALWWLGLLYRQPRRFENALKALKKGQAAQAAAVLYLHALPYIVLFSMMGRWLLYSVLGFNLSQTSIIDNAPVLLIHSVLLTLGIGAAMLFGIIMAAAEWINKGILMIGIIVIFGLIGFWMTDGNPVGLFFAFDSGVMLLLLFLNIFSGLTRGLAFTLVFGLVFGLFGVKFSGIGFGLAKEPHGVFAFGTCLYLALAIILPISITVEKENSEKIFINKDQLILFSILILIFAITIGLVTGKIIISILVGAICCIISARAYYYLIHLFFIFPELKSRCYPKHPVAWDDLCLLPFLGLDRLLIAYAEYDPAAASTEIQRLIDEYPSQRLVALCAKAGLIARLASQEPDLVRIEQFTAQLPQGSEGFLARLSRIRGIVSEISQSQGRLNSLDRAFLREPIAALLIKKIENLQSEIAKLPRLLAKKFGKATNQWLVIAENQQRLIQNTPPQGLIPTVFQTTGPINPYESAFVSRKNFLNDLSHQFILNSSAVGDGLVLQGQLTGKSTLLRQSTGSLSLLIYVTAISIPNSAKPISQTTFIMQIAQRVTEVIAPSWMDFPILRNPDTSGFDEWLQRCNVWLVEMSQHLILAIDDYEIWDHYLNKQVLNKEFFEAIENSIQNDSRITWCFSGNRSIAKLHYAPLIACLSKARSVVIPPFEETETRQLLTDPLRHSRLWSADDPKRPRFDPAFWGENGIERVHAEAGGWPYLVQLLAETVVDLCNDREQEKADQSLLEQAIAKAIVSGDAVLRQLMQPEDASPNEWAYLCGFRAYDTQPPPDNEAVYEALRRRLLITDAQGQWQLRVPLMQRWLRKQG